MVHGHLHSGDDDMSASNVESQNGQDGADGRQAPRSFPPRRPSKTGPSDHQQGDPRAPIGASTRRRGIESSELIVDPPPLNRREDEGGQGKKGVDSTHDDVSNVKGGRKGSNARSGGRRKRNMNSDDHSPGKNAPPDEMRAKSNGLPRNGSAVSAPRITLCVADTLTAAHSLLDSGPVSAQQQQHVNPEERAAKTARAPDTKHKIGILNMASPLSPGGGFLNGATSQEETLCMRTTLLPALRDEFYRLPELGVVYTPDVLVFRPSSFPSGGGATDETDILPKNAPV
ncbi:hypothetical protein EKO27_g10427, partial [Xylaria grammica]